MSASDSLSRLMERLRAGEEDAARVVFERHAAGLVALARTRLDARLAGKVDPEDVVQSAYKSFFVRQRDGRLHVGDWQGLWGLLVVITLRKCADRAEQYRAARRDVGRELAGAAGPDEPAAWQLALDREPGPVEAALLAETVEELFRGVDQDSRPVLELSLQGYTASEISERLGRAERTVRRLRERVRARLQRMQAG
jgi:RNA polymerase sigma-70 factor (ECF subfamily)